ncbi:MAG: hypothetical protein IT454_19370 [Planctomycetes bacterium]|nr:hypothetical protein [Planctomycetota bacterium]
MIALLVALVQVASPTPAGDRTTLLPPRAPIAGLAGFQSSSSIEFAAEPTKPHALEATYVFPERARWQLAPRDAAPGERHVVFRCAGAFFELAAGESASRLVSDAGPTDENWRRSLAGVELRRALFLWPDGFAWTGQGATRSAPLDSGEELEVELDADGRPSAIFVRGARDVRETYREIRWREQRERWWPSTMELVVERQLVWRERVESLETQVRVLDLYFLPADRRAAAAQSTASAVAHADVPACYWRREVLPDGTDWDAVTTRWRDAIRPYAQPAADAWKLAGGACVELDDSGAPRALLLCFSEGRGTPPEGLLKVREHTALTSALQRPSNGLGACRKQLAAAIPATASAGVAYARFVGEPSLAGPVQVVLPFQPKE